MIRVASLEKETETDEELARLILNEDLEAFERLYLRHFRRIYRLAYSMMGDRLAAEDLTQDIFIRMHQKIGRFSSKSSFGTWFYRLAVNCSLSYRRSKSKGARHATEIDPELIPMPDALNKIETDLLQKQVQEQVQKALLSLKPKLRMTFILKDIEGLSYEQIAEQMNCSPGTVGSRLSHARILLARKLEHLKGTF